MDGVSYNLESLQGYKKTAWSDDYFVEISDSDYKLCFYTVEEHRMGAYLGHLALFKDDLQIVSSGNIWIWYSRPSSFIYAKNSDCLIFRMSAFKNENEIKSELPFLFIKPESKKFSLVDWTFTSIYYTLDEVSANHLEVKEVNSVELDRINSPRKTGEIINLDSLIWYDLSNFNKAQEIYFTR
jgi:hypothetical protein